MDLPAPHAWYMALGCPIETGDGDKVKGELTSYSFRLLMAGPMRLLSSSLPRAPLACTCFEF